MGEKGGSDVRKSLTGGEEKPAAGKQKDAKTAATPTATDGPAADQQQDGQTTSGETADGQEGKNEDTEDAVIPAADRRNIRRIIAEDPEWTLVVVPNLSELILRQFIANFQNDSQILFKLNPDEQASVLSRIPTTLPLQVTAPLVDDEGYWERCCRARWEVCDLAVYGNCWKRMFFERHVQNIIELTVPGTTDPTELNEALQMSAKVVRKLDIRQLLPPVEKEPKPLPIDKDSDDESDSEEEEEQDHFEFEPVLKALPHVEELHVTYSVRDCGMNFEWNTFLFKANDCLKLAKTVAACHTLRVLRLYRSKVDDQKARVLIGYLLNHPTLEELDLSCNIIGDKGARAVGMFLNNRSRLVRLNLMDNNIRATGALAIAHGLVKSTTLEILNLRLNHLSDEGGQAIARGLLKNQKLREANLSSNELGDSTASMLAQALMTNTTIRTLDLSSNKLGADGGRQLRECMETNTTITHIDLRLTDCGQESEYCISLALHRNREAARDAAIREREARLPPQREALDPQEAHRYVLPPDLVY